MAYGLLIMFCCISPDSIFRLSIEMVFLFSSDLLMYLYVACKNGDGMFPDSLACLVHVFGVSGTDVLTFQI